MVPKRAVALCFTNDEMSLIVADKAGEALRYTLEGQDWTTAGGGHLLGHFSMLLDMVCMIKYACMYLYKQFPGLSTVCR
jgi:hypothetical protein